MLPCILYAVRLKQNYYSTLIKTKQDPCVYSTHRHNIYYLFYWIQRSTGSDITEDEARSLCNKSISDTPAVREFSDQLAEEDTDIVFTQCVYDIVVSLFYKGLLDHKNLMQLPFYMFQPQTFPTFLVFHEHFHVQVYVNGSETFFNFIQQPQSSFI